MYPLQLALFDSEPDDYDSDEWITARVVCLDCGQSTTELGEYYMVRDDVWNAAAEPFDGMLCVACLEARLGRRLTAADFTDVEVNKPWDGWKSARLMDRLARSSPDGRAVLLPDTGFYR